MIQIFGAIKILIYAIAWSPWKGFASSSVFIFKWFNSASDCQVLKYEPSHLWVTQFHRAVALPSESFLGVNQTVSWTHKNILVKISRVNFSPPLSKPHRSHPHLPTENHSYYPGLNKKTLPPKGWGVKRYDLPFRRLSAFFFCSWQLQHTQGIPNSWNQNKRK